MKNFISESTKLHRKMIERNRRIPMKGLCYKLISLIQNHHYKQDQLDQAVVYIKELKGRIDELQKKVRCLHDSCSRNPNNSSGKKMESLGLKLPIVEVRDLDSSIRVSVITGCDKNFFMLYEVISILQEEGAEVVTANIYTIGDKTFYTLHAQGY